MTRIRRIRFSVAALLLGIVPIAGAALVFARWDWRIRAEAAAIEFLKAAGGEVHFAPPGPPGEGADRPPEWFLALVGKPEWRPVWSAGFYSRRSHATNEHIRAMSAFRDLRFLSAGRCSADDSAFDCLRNFPRLEHLTIQSKNITGTCLRQIVSSSLEWLVLRDCPIEDTAVLQLDTTLPIETLDLSNTRITDVALAHVVTLADLRVLAVEHTRIKGHGFKNANSRRLGQVNLSYTAVDDTTVPYLCELSSLSVCVLNGTAITNTGLLALAQLPQMGPAQVEARDTRITSEGTLALFDVRPDVMVIWDHFKASGWPRSGTGTIGTE
jgi:hypothetical protein